MKFLTISLLAIATLFTNVAFAACPTSNLLLNSQAEVDNFATNYPGCTTLPSGIKLTVKGTGITNLDGLDVLTQVDGKLRIECQNVTDIDGLMNITAVNGELQFKHCHLLTNLDALSGLTTCHDLELVGLDALTDISGLSGLTSFSGELNIKDCDVLTNLNGLENISSIGRSLRLDGNAKLTDLTALDKLTSVGTSVYILNNASLTSLEGINNITSIGNDLDVYDNPNLSNCIGACQAILGVGGNVDISNNAPGTHCSNQVDLDADCLVALPVELSDFRAKVDKKTQTVILSWMTVAEINNKHFEIERASDGRTFETIGIVAGNGTTTKVYNYSFVDSKPIAEAYYRLKQVDYAGDFTYSNIVLVEMVEAEVASVEAYPTIANNEITIRFKGFDAQKGTYNIFNAQGLLVHTENVDLSNKTAYKPLDISKYANGIYTIVISNGSNHVSTNFVVVK